MKNPLFKLRNTFFYAVAWLLVTTITIPLTMSGYNFDLYTAIIDALVFNTILFGLGFCYWYPARFIQIDNTPFSKIIVKHFFASIVSSMFWVWLSYLILKSIFINNHQYVEVLNTALPWCFIIGFFFYDIIVSFYYLYIYYNNFHEKLVKESEFKSLLKEAELKSLKYQINPHFIFNSLNSISSLTMIDPAKAREMTIKLSEYLRSTLANNERQKSLLRDEIKNSKLYLDIEKVRFGDRFDYFEEIKSECSEILVPSMVIQPLLENAIKYGVYESIDKVQIKLYCTRVDGYLKISLENNYDEDNVQDKGEKIGLKNIKERLRLMYNQDNLLTVEKVNNIFKVNLFIPLDLN